MCAADVPTAFPRSAADWRQGVHSERGKESTRSAAAGCVFHKDGSGVCLPQGRRRGVSSPRTAAGCVFPKDGGGVCLLQGWRRGVSSPRMAAGCVFPKDGGGVCLPQGWRRGVSSPRMAAGCDFPKDGGLTRRGQRKLPKPSAAFSLKLAWRQTAPLPEHRFATRYRSGDMRSVSRLWRGVSSSSSRTLPLPSERGTLCDAVCGRLARACAARCRAQQRGRSPLQGELRPPQEALRDVSAAHPPKPPLGAKED